VSPRLVCGWCRREMSPGSEPVSHGICAPCRASYFPAPKTSECPDVPSPGSRRPGDVAPALPARAGQPAYSHHPIPTRHDSAFARLASTGAGPSFEVSA
jgi:hypothetical protein